MPEIVKKLSRANFYTGPEAAKLMREKSIPLYTVFGIAYTLKHGDSDNGPWTAAVGTFEAQKVNEKGEPEGEPVRGTQLFLPDVAMNMIAPIVANKGSCQFAVQVGGKPNDTQMGYEYWAKELIEDKANNPLDLMRKQLTAGNSKKEDAKKK